MDHELAVAAVVEQSAVVWDPDRGVFIVDVARDEPVAPLADLLTEINRRIGKLMFVPARMLSAGPYR